MNIAHTAKEKNCGYWRIIILTKHFLQDSGTPEEGKSTNLIVNTKYIFQANIFPLLHFFPPSRQAKSSFIISVI
jgi:hypothetical protein